jgi:hypothetical protein
MFDACLFDICTGVTRVQFDAPFQAYYPAAMCQFVVRCWYGSGMVVWLCRGVGCVVWVG